METRLTNLLMSEKPLPDKIYKLYMDELKTLRTIITKRTNQPNLDFQSNIRFPLSTPDLPSSVQLNNASGSDQLPSYPTKFPSSPKPKQGTYRNDYPDIQNRASSASFDTNQVGGLDYKERVKTICSRIEPTNLGKPEEFGCISDQNSVSDSYSWKGNYEMVCSRLGNTWGAWYPEMMGCPKQQ